MKYLMWRIFLPFQRRGWLERDIVFRSRKVIGGVISVI
jgi:hypothetical protein